jgi:hypothetical protein
MPCHAPPSSINPFAHLPICPFAHLANCSTESTHNRTTAGPLPSPQFRPANRPSRHSEPKHRLPSPSKPIEMRRPRRLESYHDHRNSKGVMTAKTSRTRDAVQSQAIFLELEDAQSSVKTLPKSETPCLGEARRQIETLVMSTSSAKSSRAQQQNTVSAAGWCQCPRWFTICSLLQRGIGSSQPHVTASCFSLHYCTDRAGSPRVVELQHL